MTDSVGYGDGWGSRAADPGQGLKRSPDPHLWQRSCGPHSLASRLLPMPRDFHFALRRKRPGHHGCAAEGRGSLGIEPLQSLSSLLSSQRGYSPTEAKSDQQLHHPEVGGLPDTAPVLCILGPLGQQRTSPEKQGPQGHQDNQTGRTNGTRYTVERWCRDLVQLCVWAESNCVHGYKQSLNASTGEMGLPLTWWGLRLGLGTVRGSGLQIPSAHGVMMSCVAVTQMVKGLMGVVVCGDLWPVPVWTTENEG